MAEASRFTAVSQTFLLLPAVFPQTLQSPLSSLFIPQVFLHTESITFFQNPKPFRTGVMSFDNTVPADTSSAMSLWVLFL